MNGVSIESAPPSYALDCAEITVHGCRGQRLHNLQSARSAYGDCLPKCGCELMTDIADSFGIGQEPANP